MAHVVAHYMPNEITTVYDQTMRDTLGWHIQGSCVCATTLNEFMCTLYVWM